MSCPTFCRQNRCNKHDATCHVLWRACFEHLTRARLIGLLGFVLSLSLSISAHALPDPAASVSPLTLGSVEQKAAGRSTASLNDTRSFLRTTRENWDALSRQPGGRQLFMLVYMLLALFISTLVIIKIRGRRTRIRLLRNEHEMRSAALYTRSLIEAGIDPLLIVNLLGRVTDVNAATEKITGRNRSKLIGTNFFEHFDQPDRARAAYKQTVEQGAVRDCQLTVRHIDGHATSVLYNASVYRDELGEVIGVCATIHDVSEREQAEAMRNQLAAIVEFSNDAIIAKTPDGIITGWNKSAERIYGYPADEIIGKPVTLLVPPARHAETAVFLERIRHGETVANHDSERIRKDGTLIHVALSMSPIKDSQGNITGISVVARDITEKKRLEERMHQASIYNRSLIEASLDPLVTISPDGKITDVNHATEQVTGRDRTALIGTDFSDYFTVPEQARAGYQQVLRDGSVTDYPLAIRHRDGHVAEVLYNASLYRDEAGKTIGVFAAARDITDRKRAEELIRRNNQLLETVFSSIHVMIAYLDKDFTFIKVNKAYAAVDQRTPDFFPGKNHFELYPNDENKAIFQQVVETGEPRIYYAKPFEYADHPERGVSYWDWRLEPIIGADGKVEALLFSMLNVTEQTLAKKKVEESAAYARSLIEASLDPLVTISPDGKITDVNVATEIATGKGRSELIGTDFLDYFTEPERARAGYQQVFRDGTVTNYPLAIRHHDGRVTEVLYNATLYRDQSGNVTGVFAAARDVTERNKAEQKVAQLSLQNRLILDSAGEGIYGLDNEGKCTFVNPAAMEILGFREEELIGQHSHALFHHTRPDGTPYREEQCPVQEAYKQGVVHSGLDRYWRKDGSSFPVEFTSTPIVEAGTPTGAVVVFRDITERKMAEERLQRSEHGLAEAQRIAHLGNWELDLPHNALTWSDEIYRIFEIDPEKFGASYEAFLDAIHPDDRDMVNNALTTSVRDKKPYDIVHRLQMKDGRIKYVNEKCETHYSEDGKPLRSFGTVHDITAQKEAELELTALKNELEHRVVERTAELADANKELEAFAYSVSHDLRTPLRAIDGFSLILLDDYSGKLDDEGKRVLNVVRDNTKRMAQLIEDILHFSRAGRGEIKLADVDMAALARDVLAGLQPLLAGRQVRIEQGELPHALGDPALLHQVVENLLTNAIKFTRPKEQAHIEFGGRIENGMASYFIRDNGVGFDMQYVGKLFGTFQRLHSVEEFEGTGIGLAIVKRIVNRLGGNVRAEGEVGKGATLYFTLPAAVAAPD